MASAGHGGKRKKVFWSDGDDRNLIYRLREAKLAGMQSDNGWKPQVWPLCRDAVAGSSGAEKTAEKCADHWTNMKAAFNEVRKLRDLSGFGWDDGLKIVVASDDVWDAYLTRHPGAKKWRKKPFPLYDDILFLVDGKVATGAGAFHAGTIQSQPPSDVLTQSQTDANTPPADDESLSQPEGSGDTSTDTVVGDDDDLVASSPVAPAPTTRKRAASSSPNKSARPPSRRTKRNADAVSEIAGALRQVAMSLIPPESPDITKRAIQMMDEDNEFSSDEEPAVMRLFTKEVDVARTYINDPKKSRRTTFVRSILADTEL